MEPLDQLDDFSIDDIFNTYEYRLMVLTEYLETALLLMLIACVWAIYRHISKKALLPLMLVACALAVEVTIDFILQKTNAALYIEEGSMIFTALNWSSHMVFLLACLSMVMLITNGAISKTFSRSDNNKASH